MTILFYDDWDQHPRAIVDTSTTNTSFLRMSALYRDMGIKNHSFMLSLLNPELKDIDPFDNDPSIERMAMIAIEAKQNFWYFLRTCARVPGTASANSLMFKANRGNLALYWLFFNHIMTILIQIRQTGKSFSTGVLMSYLMNIRCVNTQINLITKDDVLRAATLTNLKSIDDEFPFYLKQRTRIDLANTEELTVKSLGNAYKAHLPNKSPKIALNLGRGLTSPIFHFDEAAFLFNIGISLPAALAAGTAARDMAKRHSEPFGTILTTTAGKKDDRDGKYIYHLVTESAVWSENFLDAKDINELESIIRHNSPTGKLRVNCTFNHRQLGYTDEWLKQAIEDANAIGEDADRDFFNVWTSGNVISPLPVDLADKIRASQKLDYRTEISSPYSYVTRWYLTEAEVAQKCTHLVMGLDTSDAAGGDDIAMVIRDIKTGALVAAGNYNETNLITFSEWLSSWFVKYDNLTLIIERRSTGAMIIDYLLLMLPAKNIDPFRRIYNKVVNDKEEYPDRFKDIQRPLYARHNELYVKYKKLFGFATSATGATSRNELYSTTLLNAAKYTGDRVYDVKTIDQLLSLVIRNGRVDHEEGGHDDLCVSWILSYWIIAQGKNLDYYGINSRDILLDNKLQTSTDPREHYNNTEQQRIRIDIERIVNQMQNERDEFILMRLENQLRSVANKLVLADNEVFSIDDLVRSIKERKRLSHVAQNYNRY
jgi:hypothetical protein